MFLRFSAVCDISDVTLNDIDGRTDYPAVLPTVDFFIFKTIKQNKPQTVGVITTSVHCSDDYFASLQTDFTYSSYLILLVNEALPRRPLRLLKSLISISERRNRNGDVTEQQSFQHYVMQEDVLCLKRTTFQGFHQC